MWGEVPSGQHSRALGAGPFRRGHGEKPGSQWAGATLTVRELGTSLSSQVGKLSLGGVAAALAPSAWGVSGGSVLISESHSCSCSGPLAA